MPQLWELSAAEVVAQLKSGAVTPLQLVDAAEERWKATDSVINAMPITCFERAREQARQLMEQGFPASPPSAYLYGLPVAVKDVTPVKGLPFTNGCVALRDRIATEDDPLVQRLLEKGAIIVGKTNTPEWGAGSQTFNELFGTTLNPWDTSKTVGGSSGGSAAALAVGQVWLATGTDLGGSLRNPASFCGIVGMRNSVGVVPRGEAAATIARLLDRSLPYWRLQSVQGLLARNAEDLALGLDAVVGIHPGDALSKAAPSTSFSAAISARLAQGPNLSSSSSSNPPQRLRLAFSPDLGVPPVEQEVVQLCRAAAGWWQQQHGASLTDAAPDLQDMQEVFKVLRAHFCKGMAQEVLGGGASSLRPHIKPDLVWQLELALSLTQEQVDKAVAAHQRMLEGAHAFFTQFDFLLCPTVMLQPFDATIQWPREFEGTTFTNYIQWLKSCSLLSALDLPAVSVPCGVTSRGLPVGLQIVGAPGSDVAVLAEAAAFERAHKYSRAVPRDVHVAPA